MQQITPRLNDRDKSKKIVKLLASKYKNYNVYKGEKLYDHLIYGSIGYYPITEYIGPDYNNQ